jgi:hypothetical protein
VGWTSSGWTNGRNVERMLDILWKQGVVTFAGRDGLRRLWALADFPTMEDLPQADLICDRDRTERLWGFAYRNEMYVPKHTRKFGCYVMPVPVPVPALWPVIKWRLRSNCSRRSQAPTRSATPARWRSAYPEHG